MTSILKVLVGSQAHGLATPESDFDYRGVFIVPTQDILSLDTTVKQTNWIEGRDDDTSWELSHFLKLATKCNPTILETFLSPVIESTEDGQRLRDIFPHVWNSVDVRNAFIGYGLNQRKKMLEDKDGKSAKFAVAYLRTLLNAAELLQTGTFTIRVGDMDHGLGDMFKRIKAGNFEYGYIIDTTRKWEKVVRDAFDQNPDKKTDMVAVNEFLLDMRKKYWV